MTEEQQAALIISQSVCAMVKAMGMAASNSQYPENQPFQQKDFDALIEEFGIHFNAVVGFFRGRY